MASYGARKNLTGALEIQPSRLEFTEADASSYPLLERFRVRNAVAPPLNTARNANAAVRNVRWRRRW